MSLDRRALLRGLATAGSVGAAGCTVLPAGESTDEETPTGDGTATGVGTSTDDGTPRTTWTGEGPAVSVERLAVGLTSPTNLVVRPDTGDLYVLDQIGTCRPLGDDGLGQPALDFRDRVVVSPERGLLGMAFHPDYPEDERAFLRYSVPSREGTPDDYSHTELLTELEWGEDGPRLDTERVLIEFPSPTIFHQAGTLVFGPDGYLYVAMGEGTNRAAAQDVQSNLLGAIHRIDVDAEGEDRPYGVPDDNPLVGTEGRDEYYAWGFRNPWRMSFSDGDLIAGDVGNYRWEEVDVVEKGANYGWPYREGAHCTGWEDSSADAADCDVDWSSLPGESYTDPVAEFPHEGDGITGTAVIAGYVYGRDDIPALSGNYVFSNYTTDLKDTAGELLVADRSAGTPWPLSRVHVTNGPGGELDRVVNSIGRGPDGALYLLAVAVPDLEDRFAHTEGEVLKVHPPNAVGEDLPAA